MESIVYADCLVHGAAIVMRFVHAAWFKRSTPAVRMAPFKWSVVNAPAAVAAA